MHRWTRAHAEVLDRACMTGEMPDGSIATQQRLAHALGFSRRTISTRLQGRRLTRSIELKREGGVRSARQRAMMKAAA